MYIAPLSTEELLSRLKDASEPAQHGWMLWVAEGSVECLPKFLDGCRNAGLKVCGGVFPGVIDKHRVRREGLVAHPLPAGSTVTVADVRFGQVFWSKPLPPADHRPATAMILVDCQASGITALLEQTFDHFGNRVGYIGAGSGYTDLARRPSIFTDQGLLEGAGLLIHIPRQLSTGVRHGWQRLDGPFVASDTRGNLIRELDWRPAAEVYREAVLRHAPELAGKPLFPHQVAAFPLVIAKEGEEDIVRDPVIQTRAGELQVLSDVPQHSLMFLAQADRARLIAASLESAEAVATTRNGALGWVIECYSRTINLGPDIEHELGAVHAVLTRKAGVPVTGVLALGEISSDGRHPPEFYNKTFVSAVLHEQ
ncbi:MAG: FIST signal transduction protein [Halothiobacillaceae bacterium]